MAWKRFGGTRVAAVAPCIAFWCALRGMAACSNAAPPPSVPPADDASVPVADATSPSVDAADVSEDAGSTCAPANVHGYVPTWTPPKAPQSACTQADIDAYAACLDADDASSAACTSWGGADASTSSACRSCLADSKGTDPAWGPLVDVGSSGSVREVNVSGCMSIVLHDTGAGCAGSFQALQDCESAACADDCRGETTDALASCIALADATGCSNFVGPAACIYDAGIAAAGCFGPAQGTFGERFAAVAAVFCLEADAGE